MIPSKISRRDHLKARLATALLAGTEGAHGLTMSSDTPPSPPPGHDRRIQWWREAKYGMFVHWGLYSLLCRDAWAMGDEDIPLTEYVELAKRFQPRPNAAREWAR